MRKNKFIDKFKSKTKTELEFIIENSDKYNEEAIIAAKTILQKEEFSIIEKIIETKEELTENKTKNLVLNSSNAIFMASYLGGPLGALYLIRENFIELNNKKLASRSLAVGIISSLALIIIALIIPESIIDQVPAPLIPIIYSSIIIFYVKKYQGNILDLHKKHENKFYSKWRAFVISLISLLILLSFLLPALLTINTNSEYDKAFEKFSKNEEKTLKFYNYYTTGNKDELIKELDESIIPKWKENIEIINNTSTIENISTDLKNQNKILIKYSELRIETFETLRTAILFNTDIYNEKLELLHEKIEEQIKLLD